MWTVGEVSRLTGVSVRALHHYDALGLLKPCAVTEAGYRQYDEADLQRLGQILLFRELAFSLEEIKAILDSPDFDRDKALRQQIELLSLQKERLEKLIISAEQMRQTGGYTMNFEAFDKKTLDRYAAEAKQQWGQTEAYRECEAKTADYSPQQQAQYAKELMAVFAAFGRLRDKDPADPAVQRQVQTLQAFITDHYYTCTPEILRGLGQLYAAGGELTEAIDGAGGAGTAAFAAQAIALYGG